jgi:hypothetical protein
MDERLLDFLIGRGQYSPLNPEPLIVGGLALAISTVLFLHHGTYLGAQCFYTGETMLETGCKAPLAFYGSLAAAAAMMLSGLYRSLAIKPRRGR